MKEMKGIDVSKYQGNIDWKKVKQSGIEFVIIRVGYGQSAIDPCFKKNIEGALAAGLMVGFYWFIYALNIDMLLRNARTFHEAIAPFKGRVAMKVWCDFEYDSDGYCNRNGIVLDKETRTAWVKQFCEAMISYGWDCGVYTNPDYIKNKFGDLSMYPLWLASYSKKKPNYECFMWQYSSKGSVPGIVGNVDMNICYGYVSDSGNQEKKQNPYPVPTRTLKRKLITMRGDDVKWLQWELVNRGFLPEYDEKGRSNIDGAFGKRTEAAVRLYQDANGLIVDGSCGPITRKSLAA